MPPKGYKLVKFTEDEDNLIIRHVKLYPTNLQVAFKTVKTFLPARTQDAIAYRWYATLKKRSDVNAITCGSVKGFTKNVKNVHRDKYGVMPKQDLRSIDYLMKELLALNLHERKKILNFFK